MNLLPLRIIKFQCSKHTTALAIRNRANYAINQADLNQNEICLLFLDEVSLADAKELKVSSVYQSINGWFKNKKRGVFFLLEKGYCLHFLFFNLPMFFLNIIFCAVI